MTKDPYPRVGRTVDGRDIIDGPVPNADSIDSTLDDYDVLPGIREVPMKDFDSSPYDLFYAKNDIDHAKNLAEMIEYNNAISPLIVVIDQKGPYILEGAHRLAALHILKAKSFPALVVLDLSEEDDE